MGFSQKPNPLLCSLYIYARFSPRSVSYIRTYIILKGTERLNILQSVIRIPISVECVHVRRTGCAHEDQLGFSAGNTCHIVQSRSRWFRSAHTQHRSIACAPAEGSAVPAPLPPTEPPAPRGRACGPVAVPEGEANLSPPESVRGQATRPGDWRA